MLCSVYLRWLINRFSGFVQFCAHEECWEVQRLLSTSSSGCCLTELSPGYSRTIYKESRFYYIEVIFFLLDKGSLAGGSGLCV